MLGNLVNTTTTILRFLLEGSFYRGACLFVRGLAEPTPKEFVFTLCLIQKHCVDTTPWVWVEYFDPDLQSMARRSGTTQFGR